MSTLDFLTDRAVLTQLVGLAAMHYCSKRSVAERTANLMLTPPTITTEDKAKAEAEKHAKAAADAAFSAQPWYKRWFSRRTAQAFAPLVVFAAIQFFVVYVMPRITAERVIQAFWLCVSSYLIYGPVSNVIFVFLGGPLTMSLVRADNNLKSISIKRDTATPDAKPFFFIKRNRRILAALFTAAFVAYTAYDHRNPVRQAYAGAMIISMWASVNYFTVTIRVMCLISMGFVAIAGTLLPLIFGAVKFFESRRGEKATPVTMPPIPDWLLSLMMIYNDVIVVIPIMFLAMAAMRYDHFGPSNTVALGPAKAAPGEAVLIAKSITTRPGPMYLTVMASIAGSYLVSDALVYYLFATGHITVKNGREDSEKTDCIKIVAFVLVHLVVPLIVAFVAWTRGELKSWWSYREVWMPKPMDEETEQADVDSAEKALLEPEELDAVVAEKK